MQKIDEIQQKKASLIPDRTIITELKAKLFNDFRNNLRKIIKIDGVDSELEPQINYPRV